MSFEKRMAQELFASKGWSIPKLGLRFDRVVMSVTERLRTFARNSVPSEMLVIVTMTAPIRLASKTTKSLEDEIAKIIDNGPTYRDRKSSLCGNSIRIRVIKRFSKNAPKLVCFVHNPTTDAKTIIDLAATVVT